MENPKVFISYAWTTPAHKEWVKSFASDLTGHGIEVRLDQWQLKPGQDSYIFMESIISDPSITHVIMICDAKYKVRADSRESGSGTEAQIITQELYGLKENNKYVAVLREKSDAGEPLVPIFARGRIWIDFSDDSQYPFALEQLERWIYNEPLDKAPPLGVKPDWLSGKAGIDSPTRLHAATAVHAVKSERRNKSSLLAIYFKNFSLRLAAVRDVEVSSQTALTDFRDDVDGFLEALDEFLKVISAIAEYETDEESYQTIHRFFEDAITSCLPSGTRSYTNVQFDARHFLAYELFLLVVAILIHHSKWDGLAILLHQSYVFTRNDHAAGASCSFIFLYHENFMLKQIQSGGRMTSIETPLADQIALRRSHVADRKALIQADLILFLCARFTAGPNDGWWWPQICFQSDMDSSNFPVFLRARSCKYFERIKVIFGVKNAEDFQDRIKVIEADSGPFRSFSYSIVRRIFRSIEAEKIGTTV